MDNQVQVSGSGMRMIGTSFIVLSVIVFLTGVGMFLTQGHISSNTTQLVPWGLMVVLYIYFVGLSAGSFLISTLVYVFGVKRFESIGPLSLIQALICMLAALLLIFLDLGHPERFLYVFIHFNPTSAISWVSLLYNIYLVIIIAEIYFVLVANRSDEFWAQKSIKALKILSIIGIPVAICVHGGVGAVFAVVKSRPTWHTGLFPVIFIVSALASGGALLTFLTAVCIPVDVRKKLPLVKSLATFMICFVILDFFLYLSELLVTFYGGIPDHITAMILTLFGPYWWVFWIIQLGIGVIIPLLILINNTTRNSVGWLGISGLMVVVGILGFRFNVVIPPQIPPEFLSIPEVIHHMRYSLGYTPSGSEWLLGIGVIAMVISGMIIALRYTMSSIVDKIVSEGEVL